MENDISLDEFEKENKKRVAPTQESENDSYFLSLCRDKDAKMKRAKQIRESLAWTNDEIKKVIFEQNKVDGNKNNENIAWQAGEYTAIITYRKRRVVNVEKLRNAGLYELYSRVKSSSTVIIAKKPEKDEHSENELEEIVF